MAVFESHASACCPKKLEKYSLHPSDQFQKVYVYLLIFCLASGLLFWVVWFAAFLLPLQCYTLAAAGDVSAGQNSTL